MSMPNILMIYCDELRTDALGCYGHETVDMQTPYIDELADLGTRFTQCFCNSPVCVPSRTSQLTGLYAEDTGVYQNEAVWSDFRLETNLTTFPEVFAANGYTTTNFGKTHIPKCFTPWMISDESGSSMADFMRHLDDYIKYDYILDQKRPWIALGGTHPSDQRPYPADQVTQNALAWMEQAEAPYLVRISILQPHTPVIVPSPFDQLYTGAPFRRDLPHNPEPSNFERIFSEISQLEQLTPEEIALTQVYYYGLVAWVDSQVGLILDFLKRTNQLEDTILVFESDHGVSLGEGGRYHKETFSPESHRIPRIISFPAKLPGGQISHTLNESLDLPRTLFGLADIDAPDQFKGRDLFTEPEPEAIFATIGFGLPESYALPNEKLGRYAKNQGWPRRSCIRTSDIRLDKNVRINGMPVSQEDEDVFLVNYHTDPQEHHNLAKDPSYQNTLMELSAQLDIHTSQVVEVPAKFTSRPVAQDQTLSRLANRIFELQSEREHNKVKVLKEV